METIGEQRGIWTFTTVTGRGRSEKNADIRKSDGHRVVDYLDLATKVAELQFMNREYVLLYRGQDADYKNIQHNTSLKPSLFRGLNGINPNQSELNARFCTLADAEAKLLMDFGGTTFYGQDRLRRQKILRWSILQHYEVCKTPLLDVTQSLRVAASFATHNATSEAYVFVLGVPNLSGAITASAEAGVQIVRLSSVCPPTALRPHLQQGYLVGEYPELTGYDQKQLYKHYEIDFGRRLIAKFRFDPRTFWRGGAFQIVGRRALYPNTRDPLFALTSRTK